MASLDSQIDELYKLPLSEFTASRNALAKTLSGADAKRVRSLGKPTVVPWAINQLFWKARSAYDRLLETGANLRRAQVAALEGRAADVRRAIEAHRRALTGAVHRAAELASADGAHCDSEDLGRALEALSLSARGPESPGRLTAMLQPAGFEALADVRPVARLGRAAAASSAEAETAAVGRSRRATGAHDNNAALAQKAERLEAQRLEAERRRLEGGVRTAEDTLARTKAAESEAREALDRALEERRRAEAALAAARKALADA